MNSYGFTPHSTLPQKDLILRHCTVPLKRTKTQGKTLCNILLNVALSGCVALGKLLTFPEPPSLPSNGDYWVKSHPGSSVEHAEPDP